MEDSCIDTFNSLIRGERSAVETYEQALAKVGNRPEKESLAQIHSGHKTAVSELEKHVRSLGGQPSADSGAWGTFATTVQGIANLFGDSSALAALKQGEEHGLNDYKDALEQKTLKPECRSLISDCIANQQANITSLDMMSRNIA
jgi:uncharacterized protein (TIGR02284 family)